MGCSKKKVLRWTIYSNKCLSKEKKSQINSLTYTSRNWKKKDELSPKLAEGKNNKIKSRNILNRCQKNNRKFNKTKNYIFEQIEDMVWKASKELGLKFAFFSVLLGIIQFQKL